MPQDHTYIKRLHNFQKNETNTHGPQEHGRLHEPVMLQSVLTILKPRDGGVYVDATFGAGGHTRGILSSSENIVHSIDRDITTHQYADEIRSAYNTQGESKLERGERDPKVSSAMSLSAKDYGNRFHYHSCCFSQMKDALPKQLYDGILMDLGVSSMQLDQNDRGFSFMRDGPLAMTMGCNDVTAEDIVNHYSEKELAKIISEYGEDVNAGKIASGICQARRFVRIESTLHFADIVRKSIGTNRYGKIDSATKTFQAIRIAVNDEMGELERGLRVASDMLNIGGTLVVICFHALEIRVVKKFTRDLIHGSSMQKRNMMLDLVKIHDAVKSKNLQNSGDSEEQEGEGLGVFLNLTPHSLKPSRAEVAANPRARSALIRAIRRTGTAI